MSRTTHITSPDVAKRRRTIRHCAKSIEEAWGNFGWGGSINQRIGRERARDFRNHVRELDEQDFWEAVRDLSNWTPH